MKISDSIYYIGETNNFFTKNKKYTINDLEFYLGDDSEIKQEYVFFTNDLGASEWLQIRQLEERGFVNNNKFRKYKLKKINNNESL